MKNCFLAMLAAVGMVMVGCGGDSGNGNSGEHNDTISNDVQKLPNGEEVVCDDKMEGAVVKTADDGYYKCANGDWVKISESEALKADFILGVTDDKDVRSSSSIEKEPVSSDSKPVESSDSEKREESSSSNERVESSSSAMTTLYVCLDGTFVANMENCPSESSSSVESSSSSSVLSDNEESSSIKDGSEYDEITNTLKDLRDGKTYKTVAIGSRVWMAENLKYAAEGSACSSDDEANCDTDGRLYKWAIAMDSSETVPCGNKIVCDLADSTTQPTVRGICPEGWHLPSDADWDALIAATGDTEHAAKALKSKDSWKSYPGEDVYQFNVKVTPYRGTDGGLNTFGTALFWSSTEFVQSNANGLYSNNACGRLFDNQNFVTHNSYSKKQAMAVRCVKD